MALSRDFLLSFSSSLLKPNRTIWRKIFYFTLTNDNFRYKKINDTNNTNNINKNRYFFYIFCDNIDNFLLPLEIKKNLKFFTTP